MSGENLDVANEHEEQTRDDEAPDDGARDGAGGVAGFLAEGSGAFETNQAEDGDHHAQPEIHERDAGETELGGVNDGPAFAERNQAEQDDQGDRNAFEHQHHDGRDPDVLIGEHET